MWGANLLEACWQSVRLCLGATPDSSDPLVFRIVNLSVTPLTALLPLFTVDFLLRNNLNMNKSNERYGNEQKNAELVLPRKVQNVQI